MTQATITELEVVVFEHRLQDMGTDYNGFNLVYQGGNVLVTRPAIFRIHTDLGIVGEYPAGPRERVLRAFDMVAGYLLGKDPFQR